LFFLEKRTTKNHLIVLFRKKNYKIQQDGVVGETWVSLRGWGGRGNLGFPTKFI